MKTKSYQKYARRARKYNLDLSKKNKKIKIKKSLISNSYKFFCQNTALNRKLLFYYFIPLSTDRALIVSLRAEKTERKETRKSQKTVKITVEAQTCFMQSFKRVLRETTQSLDTFMIISLYR
ncbi:hypothetical protein PUN28_015446 [Cardiocondyla obscurior]|uniref:Uncharacterized protein n=1 Tax=Cardiocondyla obscurior TaxID=286306 RepID=A0AAW2ET50_9HYME